MCWALGSTTMSSDALANCGLLATFIQTGGVNAAIEVSLDGRYYRLFATARMHSPGTAIVMWAST